MLSTLESKYPPFDSARIYLSSELDMSAVGEVAVFNEGIGIFVTNS